MLTATKRVCVYMFLRKCRVTKNRRDRRGRSLPFLARTLTRARTLSLFLSKEEQVEEEEEEEDDDDDDDNDVDDGRCYRYLSIYQ